jgi:hypothetical protein
MAINKFWIGVALIILALLLLGWIISVSVAWTSPDGNESNSITVDFSKLLKAAVSVGNQSQGGG